MAVSVRMEPLLEKELEQAAKRRGITKSQFIVEAVERALGRNNPGELYLKVMEEMASYKVHSPVAADALELAPHKKAIGEKLRAKHTQEQADYADYLKARQAQPGGVA
jgi:predicted DNA-binding protein